jgi:hypothetical protein
MTADNIVATILVLVALACIGVVIVGASKADERHKARMDAAETLVNGTPASTYTITDKIQGKTWRAVVIDRGAVIIPGSEQLILVEKKP